MSKCALYKVGLFFDDFNEDNNNVCFCHRSLFLGILSIFYPKYQHKVAIIVSILSWLFPVVFSIVTSTADCYTFVSTSWTCSISSGCNRKCSLLIGLLFALYTFPATIIPVILYAALLIVKAKIAKKAIHSHQSDTANIDWRAIITLFITIFAFTVPSLAVLFITFAVYQGHRSPAVLYVISVFAVSIISLL